MGIHNKPKVLPEVKEKTLVEKIKECGSWVDLWKMKEDIISALEGKKSKKEGK